MVIFLVEGKELPICQFWDIFRVPAGFKGIGSVRVKAA